MVAAVATAVVLAQPADAGGKVDQAKMAFAAFRCAVFAEMSGDKIEHTRLFELGLAAGRNFVEALRSGEITDADVRAQAPLGVTMYLQGPTTDFMIGRVYEGAASLAYKSVTQQDRSGFPLPVENWVLDEKQKKLLSSDRFMNENCALIH